MTSSVPPSPTKEHITDLSSTQKTDFDKLVSDTEKKIKRSNILSIVVIVAAALLSAIGIICAIVTGVGGLWALPVGAILSAIVLLMAIHQHRSYLESKLQVPALPGPKGIDIDKMKKDLSLDGGPTPENDSKTPVDENKKPPTNEDKQGIDGSKKTGDGENNNVENSSKIENSGNTSETEDSDNESDVENNTGTNQTGGTSNSENTDQSSSTSTETED
ncbi:hypothetical protein SBV42_04100 [Chlamydia crocodili]|uniref:Uncharacterized protein n=1 Tax=Chlamydia crocodili TaxID=2766982 RepID=A0ABX8CGL0_9CHLA|nr:hypothetical protein [Chlamydia crocodili]QVE48940.1 hypothetical protein H9Q19_04465 [Chlamydia crocodili]